MSESNFNSIPKVKTASQAPVRPKPRPKPSARAIQAGADTSKDKRFSMRMFGEDYDRLTYWAERFEMDRGELLVTAMEHYIGYRNGNYDLPTAEQRRMNQLIDVITTLVTTVNSNYSNTSASIESILNIAYGENPLSKHRDDDGQL